MKTFDADHDGREAFEAEDSILRRLKSSTNCPSSIMIPICSTTYTHQRTGQTFPSIFFLPAECNLYDYMTREEKPASDGDRLRNMQQMVEICQALDWLHRNLLYVAADDEYKVTSFYHCDLNPDNILVCKQPFSKSPVFKISDFGQARGLRQTSTKSNGDRGKLGSVIPLPGREEYTYLPPECQTPESQASTAHSTTDVWSFGCILLLMIIFNHEGPQSVGMFQRKRLERSGAENNDRFYINKHAPTLNPAVVENMTRLTDQTHPDETKHNGQSDNKLTHSTLKYLKKSVLVINHRNRNSIADVLKKLRQFYNDRPPASLRSFERIGVSDKSTYCGNFPDGKMFFFSKQALRIYDQDTTDTKNVVLYNGAQEEWSDLMNLRPSLKSCAESAICVVSNKGKVEGATVSLRIAGYPWTELLADINSIHNSMQLFTHLTMISLLSAKYS